MEKTKDGGKAVRRVVEGTYSVKTMDRLTPIGLESSEDSKSH